MSAPTIPVALALLATVGCGKAVGSEGGPCTGGGACDTGLTCASSLCVKIAEGEGEGEGEACQGDDGGAHSVDECASDLPAALCAPITKNETQATCRDAGLTLRAGLFDKAYDCLAQIATPNCHDQSLISACFDTLTACDNPGATQVCNDAADACVAGGDTGFPTSTCISDLTPTNLAFRTAWADCFNNDTGACSAVEDTCYNVATNTLIDQAGG